MGSVQFFVDYQATWHLNDIELIITLNNLSIATSGNYRNFYIIDDKFYHHEINPKTGEVTVEGMTAVDDVGTIINPMIVEGQIHGGLAQGIGQALLENAAYDSNGQLLSGSYMDYTMPRADNLVDFNVGNEVTLCTHNSLGVKGCGEVGAIGSPPAVINAVVDALSELGVNDISMPATSEKIWNAINNASKK